MRGDCRSDANDFTVLQVNERPTGTPAVYGRIALNHARNGPPGEGVGTPQAGHVTRAHGVAVDIEMTANGDDLVAHSDGSGGAKWGDDELVRWDVGLQQCNVGSRVGGYDSCPERRTVIKRKAQLSAVLYDVIVRQDVARLVDHKAGAGLSIGLADPDRVGVR